MTHNDKINHFLFAIPIGLFLTILAAIGAASGMEFKDTQYGNRWDWLDWAATILGGLVGQALQITLIILFT